MHWEKSLISEFFYRTIGLCASGMLLRYFESYQAFPESLIMCWWIFLVFFWLMFALPICFCPKITFNLNEINEFRISSPVITHFGNREFLMDDIKSAAWEKGTEREDYFLIVLCDGRRLNFSKIRGFPVYELIAKINAEKPSVLLSGAS